MRHYRRSHPDIGLADYVIAATADVKGLTLATSTSATSRCSKICTRRFGSTPDGALCRALHQTACVQIAAERRAAAIVSHQTSGNAHQDPAGRGRFHQTGEDAHQFAEPPSPQGLHSLLTVCIGSNLCEARATYVNVGFGNRGRGHKEVRRKSKANAVVIEAVGRCGLCPRRRNLSATTTSPGGSSHDQLTSLAHRNRRRDPDHRGRLHRRPGGRAASRPRPGAAAHDRIPRLTDVLSVTPDRSSACPLRQPDRGWRTRPAVHSGALTRPDAAAVSPRPPIHGSIMTLCPGGCGRLPWSGGW
jgi:hypothetical protein